MIFPRQQSRGPYIGAHGFRILLGGQSVKASTELYGCQHARSPVSPGCEVLMHALRSSVFHAYKLTEARFGRARMALLAAFCLLS